jgi:hypothetical protein
MLDIAESLLQRKKCKISARIPLPTSLRSATFPRGEGIGAAAPSLEGTKWCSAHSEQSNKLQFTPILEKECIFFLPLANNTSVNQFRR